jgi:hypothetical protein
LEFAPLLNTTGRLASVLFASLIATSGAHALSISFDASTLNATPGSSVSFTGRIENNTFTALGIADDLFHNFSSYDPDILTPVDLLYAQSGSIAVNSFSLALSLFSVNVAASTAPGLYALQVSVQDIYGAASYDFSRTYDVAVNVTSAVPEANSIVLLAVGAPLMFAALRRRKTSGSNPQTATRRHVMDGALT